MRVHLCGEANWYAWIPGVSGTVKGCARLHLMETISNPNGDGELWGYIKISMSGPPHATNSERGLCKPLSAGQSVGQSSTSHFGRRIVDGACINGTDSTYRAKSSSDEPRTEKETREPNSAIESEPKCTAKCGTLHRVTALRDFVT